jgi:hypothetical protein
MARHDRRRPGYAGLKANLSPLDADILERLVEKRYEPQLVVGDLVRDGKMSESQAYLHVRQLLLNCMAKLHRGGH